MLVLLLFCLCSANFVQTQEAPETLTVPAEGVTSVSCLQSHPIPLKVKLLVEEDRSQSWVQLELNSLLDELNTTRPSLILPGNKSQIYSCSASNRTHLELRERDTELNNVTFDPGKAESTFCNNFSDWLSLTWFQHGRPIAMVTRGETRINIRVSREPSSISITSIVSPESGSNPPNAEKRGKTVYLSCKVLSGFQKFIDGQYWIIVVSALGYILFCSTAACAYMAIRRRRKVEKQRKAKARFFKVSTARNLYMESINQEPANLKQDGMYQNFSPTKDVSCDRFSNKSSFVDVSEGGDSYLEPMSPEEADEISDDGDCYENANEEIKEGSIGSQSYEDMNGPKIGQSLTPEKTCEEDADSYENMQTPVYSQLNRSINSLDHSMKDGIGQAGPSMVDVSPQQQWTASTELEQQNGDFYLSYQGSF